MCDTRDPCASDPPNSAAIWLILSNLIYLIPTALACRARLFPRAVLFVATMIVSAVYHYAHETEYTASSYYNGFTIEATWRMTQADALVSLWAACAGATLVVPMRNRASGFADTDTRVDFWVDNGVVALGGLASFLLIWFGGYNFCAAGQYHCISDWMPVWFALIVVGCVLVEVAWVWKANHALTHELTARTQHWGGRRVGTWCGSLFVLTCIAGITYLADAPRPWHGAWHISSAVALALLVHWTTPHRPQKQDEDNKEWAPLVEIHAGEEPLLE